MARLPQPGGDNGNWGDILNDYLSQTHNTDGTLKNDIVTAAVIVDGTITEAQLDTSAQNKLNTAGSGGVADGTITTAKLQDSAVTNVKVSATAAIARTKLAADVQTSLGKADSALQTAPVATVAGRTGAITLAESDITNLTTDLAAKATATTTITGATSLTGGGSLAANRTLSLVNDSATPGSSMYYGTNSGGAKGYYTFPTGAVTSTSITDSTAIGRTVLTATDATAVRTAISAGTSNLAIGTTGSTAKAGNYQPASTDISDATTTGRSLITAASTSAVKTTLGLSAAVLGSANGTATPLTLWTGTQSQYNALGSYSSTTVYVVV